MQKLNHYLNRLKQVMNNTPITRELLLSLIAEEKEKYSEYSQLCAHYQIQENPQAQSRSQGKLEILNHLLKILGSTKS